MATDAATSDFIQANFSLLSDTDDLNDTNFLEEASPEDIAKIQDALNQEEVEETMDFTDENQPLQPQGKISRHVSKSDKEIDEYAEASIKDSTKHQTKWALNVFRGKSHVVY